MSGRRETTADEVPKRAAVVTGAAVVPGKAGKGEGGEEKDGERTATITSSAETEAEGKDEARKTLE